MLYRIVFYSSLHIAPLSTFVVFFSCAINAKQKSSVNDKQDDGSKANPATDIAFDSATNEKEDAAPESKSLSMNVWGGCENDKHSIRISWWVFFSLYIYGTPILNARRDNGPRPVSA